MDLRRSSAKESDHNGSLSITSALVSAVLEWMLMFMIFIDATFAYLVTRFACNHQLRIPCLLCSRLDHILGNERGGFYWGLICHEHKSKISSLVLSQLRNNLVDVHGIHDLAQDESSHGHDIGCRSVHNEGTEHDGSSSINHTRSGDVAREIKEKSSELDQMQSKDGDPLPHVEYSQIKDASDTESLGPLSDTESATPLIREMDTSYHESVPKFASSEPQITSHAHSPSIKAPNSESENPTYPHHNVESEAPLGLELQEVNWKQAGDSKDVVRPSELLCFSDVHPSPNPDGVHSIDSKQTNDEASTIELEKEVNVECRETSNLESNSTGTDELWKQVKTDSQENSRVGRYSTPLYEIQMDSKPNKTEINQQMAGSLELGDAYRIATGTRGRQLSGKLEQNRSITDRVSEDLKMLLSQISAARGLDFPSTDMSPKLSANTEDFPRRISLERNESNLSIDGSIISEIEGESEVDRLRRQVEHDKKILITLYKELEEERNASAVAANQAMAMITRLQEEKAAFHMEALQCVRMMEEQAEYDGEALQKASSLLAEKEKQIQQFQFELEIHTNGFGDVPSSNNSIDPDINKDVIVKRIDGAPKMMDGNINTIEISLRHFEDEKQNLLDSLKILEDKLFILDKSEALETSGSDQPEFTGISHEKGVKVDKFMPKDQSIYETSQGEKEEYGKTSGQYVGKDVELAGLRQELFALKRRLEALEAEQNVIECSMNALGKGSEGFEFIQDIAAHLHELHSAHNVRRKEDST